MVGSSPANPSNRSTYGVPSISGRSQSMQRTPCGHSDSRIVGQSIGTGSTIARPFLSVTALDGGTAMRYIQVMPQADRNNPKRGKASESRYSLMEFEREFPTMPRVSTGCSTTGTPMACSA